jgi:hypothetical protein
LGGYLADERVCEDEQEYDTHTNNGDNVHERRNQEELCL